MTVSPTDIEALAEGAFAEYHARANRQRVWALQPDEDSGSEIGRNTFRAMMTAALAAHNGAPLLRPTVSVTVGAHMSEAQAAAAAKLSAATPEAMMAALEANTAAMRRIEAALAAKSTPAPTVPAWPTVASVATPAATPTVAPLPQPDTVASSGTIAP